MTDTYYSGPSSNDNIVLAEILTPRSDNTSPTSRRDSKSNSSPRHLPTASADAPPQIVVEPPTPGVDYLPRIVVDFPFSIGALLHTPPTSPSHPRDATSIQYDPSQPEDRRTLSPATCEERIPRSKATSRVHPPVRRSLPAQPPTSISRLDGQSWPHAQPGRRFLLQHTRSQTLKPRAQNLERLHTAVNTRTPPPLDTANTSKTSLATLVAGPSAATQTYPLQPTHEPFQRRVTPPCCDSYTAGERIQRERFLAAQRTGRPPLADDHRLPPPFLPVRSGHGTTGGWLAGAMNRIEERPEEEARTCDGARGNDFLARWAHAIKMRLLSLAWRVGNLFRRGRPVDERYGDIYEAATTTDGGERSTSSRGGRSPVPTEPDAPAANAPRRVRDPAHRSRLQTTLHLARRPLNRGEGG